MIAESSDESGMIPKLTTIHKSGPVEVPEEFAGEQ